MVESSSNVPIGRMLSTSLGRHVAGGGADYRLVAVPAGVAAAAATPAAAAASPRVLVTLLVVVAWVGPVGRVVVIPVGPVGAVLREGVPVGPAGVGGRVPVGPVDAPPCVPVFFSSPFTGGQGESQVAVRQLPVNGLQYADSYLGVG